MMNKFERLIVPTFIKIVFLIGIIGSILIGMPMIMISIGYGTNDFGEIL